MLTWPHALLMCSPMTSTVGSASISSSMASRSVSHIIFSFFAAARTSALAAALLAVAHSKHRVNRWHAVCAVLAFCSVSALRTYPQTAAVRWLPS